MKKHVRIIALVLAAIMMLALAACGSTGKAPEQTSGGGDKQLTVAHNTWGVGVPIVDMIGDSRQYVLEKIGGYKTIRASDDFTAEKELQNGQNFLSAGVDGICFQGCSPTVVPHIAKMCAEKKIPVTFDTQIGTEDTLAELAATNEYYLGAIDVNNVLAGAMLAQYAWDDGCKTACIIGGNIGDTNMDDRSNGFREKFESLGGKVVGEARCTDASECATKAEDMLSANRDVDCLYAMVGDYVAGSVSAIQNLGIEGLKFYLSNIDGDSAQFIKDGVINAGTDGTLLPPMLAATLMINYLNGNKIVDDKGQGVRLQTVPILIEPETVDLYIKVCCTTGVQPLADSTLAILTGKDATYATYLDQINNNMTLEKLAAALGVS